MALSATLVGASASAQTVLRDFPPTALRGEMVVVQPPEIALDHQPERLAPGTRILGLDNLLVMSAALVGQRLAVNYTRDLYGLIKDVWILSPDEQLEPRPTAAELARMSTGSESSQ